MRLRGGGATQFSISGGDREAEVSQIDFGPFVQDDWRIRPNLTLSLGLRYETQSNISDRSDFCAARGVRLVTGGGTGTKAEHGDSRWFRNL